MAGGSKGYGNGNENGWAIGSGEEYADLKYQDDVESRLLYELIERDIAPAFYTRGADGLPREWIRRMKKAISTLVPEFNTNRMVEEYLRRCYLPAHTREAKLTEAQLAPALELANWRKRVGGAWSDVRIESVEAPTGQTLWVGKDFPVKVRVSLGSIRPEEVDVQLYYGLVDNLGEVNDPKTASLQASATNDSSRTMLFAGSVPCRSSGQFGFTVRVLPKHPNLPNALEPGLVTWG